MTKSFSRLLLANSSIACAALCVCLVWMSCKTKSGGKKKRANPVQLLKEGKRSFMQGDLDAALEKYRNAVSARPSWDKAQNLLGMALRYKYYETGDASYREEEVAAFRKAVKISPKWVVPKVNLATSLWQMGRFKEACRHYGEVLRMQPDHPDARAIKRRIESASTGPKASATEP